MNPRGRRCAARACFNPLHCGAVVASLRRTAGGDQRRKFQSPSLRGSGRFAWTTPTPAHPPPSFNPLHCGAVVASQARLAARRGGKEVSIPFIAGQWSLRGAARVPAGAGDQFQSPSLRGSGRFKRMHKEILNPSAEFQSPSLRGSGRFARLRGRRVKSRHRFNPLHCGAVVASVGRRCPYSGYLSVSIPFIAGQWSLQDDPEKRHFFDL